MSNMTSLDILAYLCLGLIVFSLIKRLLCGIYTYAIGPVMNQIDFVSMGQWALITGCTDGIGKEYARQLASRGCDIILVSRSMEKLKTTAIELVSSTHKNKTVGKQWKAGVNTRENITSALIKVNIVSMIRMTCLVLPAMVKRGKGVVINIGSASSVLPTPLLTVYASTKAFVQKFSEGLRMEYGKQGIIIQCVLPGFVCSNMSGIRESSFIAPTAKDFVKSAISLVGTVTKTTGHFPHTIFVNVITFTHNTLPSFCVWLVTRVLETNRKKTMKKYVKT